MTRRLLPPLAAVRALELRRVGMALADIARELGFPTQTVATSLREPAETAPSSPSQWPPPPTAGAPWHLRWFGPAGRTWQARVREVRLWGRQVFINDASHVYCNGCGDFVPASVLGRYDNVHPVGLPSRAVGRLLPMGEDQREPSPGGLPAEW